MTGALDGILVIALEHAELLPDEIGPPGNKSAEGDHRSPTGLFSLLRLVGLKRPALLGSLAPTARTTRG